MSADRVSTTEFTTIRDAMITSINGGASQETAWAAASAPVAAGKSEAWLTNLAGLKPTLLISVDAVTRKADGLSTPDIRRLGDLLASGKSWAEAKAAFPHTTDASLEAHKTAAEAWAADHQQGFPGA